MEWTSEYSEPASKRNRPENFRKGSMPFWQMDGYRGIRENRRISGARGHNRSGISCPTGNFRQPVLRRTFLQGSAERRIPLLPRFPCAIARPFRPLSVTVERKGPRSRFPPERQAKMCPFSVAKQHPAALWLWTACLSAGTLSA